MKTHVAYCSACNREVEVMLPPNHVPGIHPGAHDAEACICLAHGEHCTGSFCPLFSVPPDEMAEALARHRAGHAGDST